MQFHHGLRLENLIKKSGQKITHVIKASGVSKGSVYKYFGLEELDKSKILPILKAIGVTYEDFMGKESSDENKELRQALEASKQEVIDLLKELRQCEAEKKALENEAKKSTRMA